MFQKRLQVSYKFPHMPDRRLLGLSLQAIPVRFRVSATFLKERKQYLFAAAGKLFIYLLMETAIDASSG